VERLAENRDGTGVMECNILLGLLFALTVVFLDRSGTFIYFRF
jgi:hypothetical protein